MRRTALLLFLLLCNLPIQAKELIAEQKPAAFGYPSLYFISGGPILDNADFAKLGIADGGRVVGAHYRVGFINSEIYTSFVIELISFGEEGSDATVRKTYFLNGFKVADAIGESRILHSEFVEWINPKSFRINIGTKEKPYILKFIIGLDGKFQLEAPKDASTKNDIVKIEFPFTSQTMLNNGSERVSKLMKTLESALNEEHLGRVRGFMISKNRGTIELSTPNARTAYSKVSLILKEDSLMKGGKVTLYYGESSKILGSHKY